MDISGLRSPQILAAIKAYEAEQRNYEMVQAELIVKNDIIRALKTEFWESQVDHVDFMNPEEVVVAMEAIFEGSSPRLRERFNNWVKSLSPHLSAEHALWRSYDGILLPLISISVTCTISDTEVNELANSLRVIGNTFNEIHEDSVFSILENSLSENGSYYFNVIDDIQAELEGSYHSEENSGTIEEMVRVISQTLPYCSCDNCSKNNSYSY